MTKKTASKKTVAKKESTELELYQGLESQAGQDDFGREDLAIPFLRILQKGSPQCDKDEGEYIEDAEPGMIFNTATQQLISGKEGILVLPVKYTRNYSEWIPRKDGGGFVADHGTDRTAYDNADQNPERPNQRLTEEGHEIVDSAFYYVIRLGEDGLPAEQALIAMNSTQWTAARRWNTQIKTAQLKKPDGSVILSPPIYAFAYRMTTHRQENESGSWYGWRITRESAVPDMENGGLLLREAKALREAVDSGAARPRYEEEADPGAPGDDVGF